MRFDSRASFARTEADVAAVHQIADQLTAAAELVDGAARNHMCHLAFSGISAGRAHTARGDALRLELERLTAEVSQWARAAGDIAAALRAGAERYADADLYAAARIA
jgi:uncharacterized protein YukE